MELKLQWWCWDGTKDWSVDIVSYHSNIFLFYSSWLQIYFEMGEDLWWSEIWVLHGCRGTSGHPLHCSSHCYKCSCAGRPDCTKIDILAVSFSVWKSRVSHSSTCSLSLIRTARGSIYFGWGTGKHVKRFNEDDRNNKLHPLCTSAQNRSQDSLNLITDWLRRSL